MVHKGCHFRSTVADGPTSGTCQVLTPSYPAFGEKSPVDNPITAVLLGADRLEHWHWHHWHWQLDDKRLGRDAHAGFTGHSDAHSEHSPSDASSVSLHSVGGRRRGHGADWTLNGTKRAAGRTAAALARRDVQRPLTPYRLPLPPVPLQVLVFPGSRLRALPCVAMPCLQRTAASRPGQWLRCPDMLSLLRLLPPAPRPWNCLILGLPFFFFFFCFWCNVSNWRDFMQKKWKTTFENRSSAFNWSKPSQKSTNKNEPGILPDDILNLIKWYKLCDKMTTRKSPSQDKP